MATPYPKSNAESALTLLPQILSYVARDDQFQSRDLALTVPQLRFMNALYREGKSSMLHLSRSLHVTPPSATITADLLVRQGLIVRKEDKSDRRVVLIQFTAKGKSLMKKLMSAKRKRWNQIMNSLNLQDQKILISALHNLLTLLQKAEGRRERRS